MKKKWTPIKGNFNLNGKHEGVPVIVWNKETNLPEIRCFYSSSPIKQFSDGTYTHFIVAPKSPMT